MSVPHDSHLAAVAAVLRTPRVPALFEVLDRTGYLAHVWPQLASSVETAGFIGSALYMADMALDAVEAEYEPQLSRESLLARGLARTDLDALLATLEVFQWVQPQTLLLCAALAEAWERPRVGGQGRPEPRVTTVRETANLAAAIELAPPDTPPLPEVAETLQLETPPELYRAVARWPVYLDAAWAELQHLAAYPALRRRGRALYYYARSASRFLATPLEASREALAAAGLSEAALDASHAAIQEALPLTATMMVHCSAMRFGLGVRTREVVAG